MIKSLCLSLLLLNVTSVYAQKMENLVQDIYPSKSEAGLVLLTKDHQKTQILPYGLADIRMEQKIEEDTQFRLASVSKQFTAMAIYRLIRAGKLQFDTPIRNILPELPASTQAIAIKHLLNHSSGLLDYESYIPTNQNEQLSDVDILHILSTQDSVYFEAGSKFRYSNSAYCLMAVIVARVSQQSFAEYCKEQIFDMIGANQALVYKATDKMHKRAYGYHPKDGKFIFADQSLTSATQGDGGVYISAKEYELWLSKHNPLFDEQYFADLEKYKIAVKDGVDYSLGWFTARYADKDLYLFHSGESTGFHNLVLFNYSQQKALVTFSNRDDLKIADLTLQVGKVLQLDFSSINNQPIFLWLSNVYANN